MRLLLQLWAHGELLYLQKAAQVRLGPKPAEPIHTSAQPELIWRPKIPLHTPAILPDGNISSPINKPLDSRAKVADPSPSLIGEQPRQVQQTGPPLSNSTMQFLLADGPEISFDDVIQSVHSDDSSTSCDASSVPNEERAQLIAAQRHCAMISLFHRKGIPATNSSGPSPITL